MYDIVQMKIMRADHHLSLDMMCMRTGRSGPDPAVALLYSTLYQSGLVAEMAKLHQMKEAVEDKELVGIGGGVSGGRCSRRAAANNLNLYEASKRSPNSFYSLAWFICPEIL